MALTYDDLNATADDFNITGIIGDFLNDTEFTYSDIFAEELAYILHVYLTPILIIVGVIGNLLSIIVFYKSKLRGQSTSQYLSALAVSDTIFLLQLIPPWLKAVKASLVFVRSGFCQSFVYLTYVSSANSSWLVVAFTVERFVAVIYPLRSRACTVRRARVCIACVGASCVALNTPVLWFAEARGADCDIDRALMEHAARFNLLDTVLSFTLPLAVTTVLNVWIMVGVCRGSRARRRLTRDARAPPPCVRPSRPHRARRTRSQLQRSQQRVTRMLLLVSSVFVLLNLPAYSMRIVAYAMNMSSYEYSGRWAALQQICHLFFNANFGINFFLYCLSGQNFRIALLHTFPCVGRAVRMLRKICCCSGDPPPPPADRPSVTNSVSMNTEGKSSAAVSCVHAGEAGAGVSCVHAGGAGAGVSCWTRERTPQGRPYMQQWRFNSSRQMRHFQEFHMQLFQVASIPSLPYRAQPPLIERPHIMNDVDVTIPEIENSESVTFRPIPFTIIPGEIAPLGTDSMPPSPGLAPSPSPLVLLERSGASANEENANDPSNGTTAAPQDSYFTPVIIQEEREFPFAPAVFNEEGVMARALHKYAFGVPVESATLPQRTSGAGRQPLCPHVDDEAPPRAARRRTI